MPGRLHECREQVGGCGGAHDRGPRDTRPEELPREVAEQHAEAQVCDQVRDIEVQCERRDSAPELSTPHLARLERAGVEPIQVERADSCEIADEQQHERISQRADASVRLQHRRCGRAPGEAGSRARIARAAALRPVRPRPRRRGASGRPANTSCEPMPTDCRTRTRSSDCGRDRLWNNSTRSGGAGSIGFMPNAPASSLDASSSASACDDASRSCARRAARRAASRRRPRPRRTYGRSRSTPAPGESP